MFEGFIRKVRVDAILNGRKAFRFLSSSSVCCWRCIVANVVCRSVVESVQLGVHVVDFAGKIPCLRVFMGIFVGESSSS